MIFASMFCDLIVSMEQAEIRTPKPVIPALASFKSILFLMLKEAEVPMLTSANLG
jgi:hypothetical protein